MYSHVDHQYAEFGEIITLPEFERFLAPVEGTDDE